MLTNDIRVEMLSTRNHSLALLVLRHSVTNLYSFVFITMSSSVSVCVSNATLSTFRIATGSREAIGRDCAVCNDRARGASLVEMAKNVGKTLG